MFVQTLEPVVKLFEVIVRVRRAIKCVERFAAAKGRPREPQPKFCAFDCQIPLAGKAREFDFAIGLIGGGMERSAPERVELGIGAGLTCLSRGQSLICELGIISVSPGAASGPPPLA